MIEETRGKYIKYVLNNQHNDVLGSFNIGEDVDGLSDDDLDWLSDDDLETYYAYGYYAFTIGNYEISRKLFNHLTSYSPYTGFYWRALGAVNQQMKNYREGISGYDKAIANDDEDYISYVYRTECYILIGEIEHGMSDLLEMVEKFPKNKENSVWIDRANLLLSIHSKTRKSGEENA